MCNSQITLVVTFPMKINLVYRSKTDRKNNYNYWRIFLPIILEEKNYQSFRVELVLTVLWSEIFEYWTPLSSQKWVDAAGIHGV